MKFFHCLVLVGTFCLLPMLAYAAIAKNLSPSDAYQLISQRQDVYLLDVRTTQEYFQVRLKGAHLIPIDQLSRRLDEIPRNQPVMVYCAVGSRSIQVVNYLVRKGFPEVYNLYGGISAWAAKGYPCLQDPP